MDRDDEHDGYTSKSQRKRAAEALQRLGETLVTLDPGELEALPLPETLRAAVTAARSIRQHGARRRQLQYIGKLMRRIDPQPLIEAMEARRRARALETARLHALDGWRKRLMAEGDAALQALFEAYPQADRQRLRQLVRRARAAGDPAVERKWARALWRALRELMPD